MVTEQSSNAGRTGTGWLLAAVAAVLAIAMFGAASSAEAAAPPNDAFGNAELLGPAPTQATGSNVDATVQANEPDHGEKSIWWAWTANKTGRFRADICQTLPSMSGGLAVYTGSAIDDLQNVAAAGYGRTGAPLDYYNGGCPDGDLSSLVFDAVAGQVYHLAVTDSGRCCGEATSSNIVLKLKKSEANDNFREAAPITAVPAKVTGSNLDASRQAFEPEHGESTIWWKWTPATAGRYRADICDSLPSFSGGLGVYTGSSVTALTNVAVAGSGSTDAPLDYNNGSCADGDLSAVAFDAVAGRTFHIAVTSSGRCCGADTTSNVVLELSKTAANDNLAEAGSFAQIPGRKKSSNVDATREVFEPEGSGYSTIWWNWTADRGGPVSVGTCASLPAFMSVASVYTGGSVGALALVPVETKSCSDIGLSKVQFTAVAGTTYHFAVGDSGSCCGESTSPNVVVDLRDVDCDKATRAVKSASKSVRKAQKKLKKAKKKLKKAGKNRRKRAGAKRKVKKAKKGLKKAKKRLKKTKRASGSVC